MSQPTSRQAYELILEDLGDRQKTVYNTIYFNPGFCNSEIASRLGWSINKITPRVLELREMGLVEHLGFKVVNGRRSMTWHASSKETQKEVDI